MNNKYKIVYTGTLKAGTDSSRFVEEFSKTFKVPQERAQKLAALGHSDTLKEGIDQSQAEKYQRIMESLGMEVHIEPIDEGTLPFTLVDEPGTTPGEPAPEAEQKNTDSIRCPKCGSDRVQGDDCLACGIIIPRYLERQSRLQTESPSTGKSDTALAPAESGESKSAVPESFGAARSLPIGRGLGWIVEGGHYFRRDPLPWIGAVVVWYLIMAFGGFIPLVGPIATTLLGPVLMAGFFMGADVQRDGGAFEVSHLFEGFYNNVAGLIIIGVINLVAITIIFLIAFGLFTGSMVLGGAEGPSDTTNLMLAGSGAVTVGLFLLWGLANVLAPPLVALNEVPPLKAMKMSLTACLKNALPILLYMVVATLLMLVSAIPLGLGMLVSAPVLMAATYASYRDIFYAE